MDGENNGNPYKNGWFGGNKTHHFRKHPCIAEASLNPWGPPENLSAMTRMTHLPGP